MSKNLNKKISQLTMKYKYIEQFDKKLMKTNLSINHEITAVNIQESKKKIANQIFEELKVLKEQVENANGRLRSNLKILDQKQMENKTLNELLMHLENNLNNVDSHPITEISSPSDSVCVSCKKCQIF